MRGLSFPEKAERVLIATLLLAIVMIAQQYSLQLYRYGLLLLVGATLLQIAVGNLPKDASAGESLKLIAAVLAIVATVFGIGVLLVPYLSQLGR